MPPWQYRPWPVSLSDLLLILILLILGSRLIALVTAGLYAGGAPGAVLGILLLGAQSALLFMLIRAIAVQGRGLTWPELGLGAFDRQLLPRAVLMGFLAVLLSNLIFALVQSGHGEQLHNPQVDMLRSIGTGFGGAFLMIFLATTVVPFVEELAFRGLLYGWLRQRFGLWQSVAISSVFFAVMHDSILLVPVITVVGIVLALLYERHQSIWPCVIAHGTFNGINLMGFYVSSASGA